MKRVIVSNTGDRETVGKLLSDRNLDVLFVSEPQFRSQYPAVAKVAVVEDLNDPAASVEQIISQVDISDRTHVLSLTERSALTAGYLRSYLALPGPAADVVLNTTNKLTMKRRFMAAGLPTAVFALGGNEDQVRASAERIGFPVIIKPVMGAGADATIVVQDLAELNSAATAEFFASLANPKTRSAKKFPLLVEEALPLTAEYHCDGLVQGGVIRYVRVSRYSRPVLHAMSDAKKTIYGSFTLPMDDPTAKRIMAMHSRAVHAVGLMDGVTHFEVLAVNHDLYAGEIAARNGGGGIRRMLQLRDGVDIKEAYIAMSLGEQFMWEQRVSDTEIADLMLPAQFGVVEEVSTASDFSGIEHVLEVDMRLKSGDVVNGWMDSSTASGIVYARLPADLHVDELIGAVAEAFRLRIEPALP